MKPSFKLKSIALTLILSVSLLGCNSTTVPEYVTLIVTGATNVITLVSAFTGNPVNQTALTQINNDAQLFLTAYNQWAAEPANTTTYQKVQEALSIFKSDLGSLLTALHVSDPTHQAEIVAVVTVVIDEVTSIGALITQSAPIAARSVSVNAVTAQPPSAATISRHGKNFRAAYNAAMKKVMDPRAKSYLLK